MSTAIVLPVFRVRDCRGYSIGAGAVGRLAHSKAWFVQAEPAVLLPYTGPERMKYQLHAIFYQCGVDDLERDNELVIKIFEAKSDDCAIAQIPIIIDEVLPVFSRVFKLYRIGIACPIHKIIKPSAYEVDEIYIESDGSKAHAIFDAFDAKDEAEARQKLLERSSGRHAVRYKSCLDGVVQLYRVPFYNETLKPFEDNEREFLGTIEIEP